MINYIVDMNSSMDILSPYGTPSTFSNNGELKFAAFLNYK